MPDPNLTQRARHVLDDANRQAAALGHEYIGTEHLLLALLGDNGGVVEASFEQLGVERGTVKAMIRDTVSSGAAPSNLAQRPLTSRSQSALELATAASRKFGHSYVGAEHLLLGLVDEGRGIAAQALADRGVTGDALRPVIARLLGPELSDFNR